MKGNLFWKFLTFWTNVSLKYNVLKEDPEARENSVALGVRSLVLSILGVILTAGFGFLTYICFSGSVGKGLESLLLLFGGILSGIVALVCLVDMLGASLMYAIYQRKLNKKPLGIAALIISIVLIVAVIVGVIVILLVLANN